LHEHNSVIVIDPSSYTHIRKLVDIRFQTCKNIPPEPTSDKNYILCLVYNDRLFAIYFSTVCTFDLSNLEAQWCEQSVSFFDEDKLTYDIKWTRLENIVYLSCVFDRGSTDESSIVKEFDLDTLTCSTSKLKFVSDIISFQNKLYGLYYHKVYVYDPTQNEKKWTSCGDSFFLSGFFLNICDKRLLWIKLRDAIIEDDIGDGWPDSYEFFNHDDGTTTWDSVFFPCPPRKIDFNSGLLLEEPHLHGNIASFLREVVGDNYSYHKRSSFTSILI